MSETDQELFRLTKAHRVMTSIWSFLRSSAKRTSAPVFRKFNALDVLQMSADQFAAFQRSLKEAGVPKHLLATLDSLFAKEPLVEFSLVEDWAEVCGRTTLSGEAKVDLMAQAPATVTRYTCENNSDFGEIHYQVSERPLIFKTFNLDQDWAAIIAKDRPNAVFSLSDVVRQLVSSADPIGAHVASRLLERKSCAELIRVTQEEHQRVAQTLSPVAELVSRTELLPVSLRKQLVQVAATHSVSPTQMALVAQELKNAEAEAQVGDQESHVRELLAGIFRQLSQFARLQETNAVVWLQMCSEIDRFKAGQDLNTQATALNRLSLLINQLQSTVPEPVGQQILVPLSKEDFLVIFNECQQLFLVCESPMAHVCLTRGRCLYGATADTLRVRSCEAHNEEFSGQVLGETSLLLQSRLQRDDINELNDIRIELRSLTLASEARKPLGWISVFVPVAEVLPGEELLSTPDARSFVAVKRAVLPPQAVITLQISRFILVLQDL
jgi:hypothetical protein